MMKVGIVTIYDPNSNYGNKLQNYATIRILKEMGMDVETIVVTKQPDLIKTYLKRICNRICGYKLSKRQYVWRKYCKFYYFSKKYLNPVDSYLKGKLKPEQYDYFILGSDQVWNPNWYDDLKKQAFLLTFAYSQQKVCMSPSFGIEKLPDEWEEWFRQNLMEFNYLSVREEAGVKIIKELTGKDAEILVDPTLLLDREKWNEIAKQPRKINTNSPYILTYFLGGRSERINRELNYYANENRLKVYNLVDDSNPDMYSIDPGEFIYLISHATLVMTDSFHACVFSFLFKKPFLVYQRNNIGCNMMSRIETLLEKFDLQRKYVDSGLENEILECDYQVGNQKLEMEKKRAIDFLKKSMELKEQ